MDAPEIFENLGFVYPEGSFLTDPCLSLDFAIDYIGEVAGTQVSLKDEGSLKLEFDNIATLLLFCNTAIG